MFPHEEDSLLKDVRVGEAAAVEILKGPHFRGDGGHNFAPEDLQNAYSWDGGSVFGSIRYQSFECRDRESCLLAYEQWSGLSRQSLLPWKPSEYAVIMEGPAFYHEDRRTNLWSVSTIRNGLMYEQVTGGDRRMDYFAIDLDKNRVFHHYESGGFPTDRWNPPGDIP